MTAGIPVSSMEDNLSKFLKIAGLTLLTGIIFLLSILLIVLGLRFFFGLFGHMAWVVLMYKMLILALPVVLFITVYVQFFRITRRHSVKMVRMFSQSIFILAGVSWLLAYAYDLRNFITASGEGIIMGQTVRDYLSFNTFFLTAHVSLLLITGVIQALAAPPEKDWMEKAREKEPTY